MTFQSPSTLCKTSVTRTVTSCGLPVLSFQAKCWAACHSHLAVGHHDQLDEIAFGAGKISEYLVNVATNSSVPFVLQRPGKIVNVDVVLVIILRQVVGIGGGDHLVFNIPDRILILG